MSVSVATVVGVVGVPSVLAQAKVNPVIASSSRGLTYVVVKNDSLSRIASKANVSMTDLLAVNGFSSKSVIHPGQVINLPDYAYVGAGYQEPTSPSTSGNTSVGLTYVVQRNDSLSRIASLHKVRLDDLLAVNNFSRKSVIVPGQVIKLPSTAVIVSAPAVTTPPNSFSNNQSAWKIQAVVDFAKAQVGKPYLFKTAGPATYDCSGLTKASYAVVGVKLPHQSLQQSKLGVAIDWKTTPIQAGDLIFTFSSANPTQISHVGIAISATQWIEAPNSGTVVRIARIPSETRIQAVRRFL